jgi:hypothetical protein
MVCDNDQSPSDASTILETNPDEENVESQRPLGTGVGYVSPTNISPEIPVSKNKLKKNPPISEVEVVKSTNPSELLASMDTTRTISSTTESTTIAIDMTTKYSIQNSTNVRCYFFTDLQYQHEMYNYDFRRNRRIQAVKQTW